MEDAIGFIAGQNSFAAEQLPGLEYESRLILTKNLFAAGFIEKAVQAA